MRMSSILHILAGTAQPTTNSTQNENFQQNLTTITTVRARFIFTTKWGDLYNILKIVPLVARVYWSETINRTLFEHFFI